MSLPASNENDPISRANAGDRDARDELLKAHGPMVWGICKRMCREPEDAYQGVWEKVFGALERFDTSRGTPFGSWVATIAHRHLVDMHRRRKVRGEILPVEELPSLDPGADETLQKQQRHRRLERAIAELPMPQRRVVLLHHMEGMTLEAIASGEEVAVGTIKSRLHRARARLAGRLTEGVS